MQLKVRMPDGENLAVEMDNIFTVEELKENIFKSKGLPVESQILFNEYDDLTDSNLRNVDENTIIDLALNLKGGVGSSDIPDHLKELAYKYKVDKMICRKCYARLPKDAKNCRKRKCGHYANIRPKKHIKDKGGKK